jgi:dUTPase
MVVEYEDSSFLPVGIPDTNLYEFRSPEDHMLFPNQTTFIDLKLRLSLPIHLSLSMQTTQGLTAIGIIVVSGDLSIGNETELVLNLLNTSANRYIITKGQKILHGRIVKTYNPAMIIVKRPIS